jgi:serine phosphatase RsbU (regulator of sigma subunit)
MSNITITAGSEKNKFIIKTEIFVIVGYSIVTIETFIARMIGLIKMSYYDIVLLGIIVIAGTSLSLLINLFKKSIGPNLEKVLFAVQIILYIILFSTWVYRLVEIRPFALFSSLFAIIVVISYTNLLQSLIISVSTVISFIAICYYAETIARQSGNFIQDMFYAFCFIPISIFISISASQMTKKNKELERAKQNLEEKNDQLILLNRKLEHTQKMAKIELDLAHDIQKSLLPEQPLSTKLWDIALFFKPRYGISGDFYDFYYEDGILRGLSLFDVSGHGVASALVTILAKPVLHRYFNLVRNDPLGRMIELANNTLKNDLNEINMFITGIILRFNNEDIDYINAGHPDPLYKSKISGKVNVLSESSSNSKTTPIGIIDSISTSTSVKLSPKSGDVLLLYTDCLTESNDLKKSRYGYERLKQSLEEAPDSSAHEILDYLLERFFSFLNEKEIEDDFTIIIVKKLD